MRLDDMGAPDVLLTVEEELSKIERQLEQLAHRLTDRQDYRAAISVRDQLRRLRRKVAGVVQVA